MTSLYIAYSADFPHSQDALARVFQRVMPQAHVVQTSTIRPGQGWLEAAQKVVGGQIVVMPSVDMVGRATQARYLSVKEKAYVDVSELLGPAQKGLGVKAHESSSFGIGELVRLIYEAGHREVILVIGEVATLDFGVGIAARLGVQCLTQAGQAYLPVGATLNHLGKVSDCPLFGKKSPLKISLWGEDKRTWAQLTVPEGGDDERAAFEAAYAHLTTKLKMRESKLLRQQGGAMGQGMGAVLAWLLQAPLRALDTEQARLGLNERLSIDADWGIWINPTLEAFSRQKGQAKRSIVIHRGTTEAGQAYREAGALVVISSTDLALIEEQLTNLMKVLA